MLERIILTTIALGMFRLTATTKDKLSIFLTAGLTLGVLLTWTRIPRFITIGMMIFMMTALVGALFQIRGLFDRSFIALSLFLLCIMIFLVKLFLILNWPHSGELILGLAVPILLFLFCLPRRIHKRNEFGFWVILVADSLSQVMV